MEIVHHSLFHIPPLVDCVLGYVGCDVVNYWLRSAAQKNQTLSVATLSRVPLFLETMCAIAAMKDRACFTRALSCGTWHQHLAQLCKSSSKQNFDLLINQTPYVMIDVIVSALGNCTADDIQKMDILITKYPKLCCDNLFDSHEPFSRAKFPMMCRVVKNVSTKFIAKQVAFDASDELIRFCFKHNCAAWNAFIRVQLLKHPEDACRASISTLKLLSDSKCILPCDRPTYCLEAFRRGHTATFDFFYDASQMNLDDVYASVGITSPTLFQRHINMLSLMSLYGIVRVMKPCFFGFAPCVLDALRQRCCNGTQMPIEAIAAHALIQGNLPLLNALTHIVYAQTILWDYCWNQVVHHFVLPMQTLMFMFTYFPKVVMDYRMGLFQQIIRHHQTEHLCFCVQHGIIEPLKIHSRWNEPQIAAMWDIPEFHNIFNKEQILHDAIYFRNESAVVFLLTKGVRVSAEILETHACFLSQMGLSGVLSNLHHVRDPELCYSQMRGSVAHELVRVLWKISPLTNVQLMHNNLFWNIAAKSTEAARFLWQTRVLTEHDLRIMTRTIPQHYKQHALRFLDSVHHDF